MPSASLIDPNTPNIVGQNANQAGSNMAVPTSSSFNTPAIGGTNNPLLPQFPGGTATPPVDSSINLANVPAFPANGTGSAGPTVPSGSSGASDPLNVFQNSNEGAGGPGGSWLPNQNDFIKAMRKAGFSAGDAGMLFNFLQSGAGFNSKVAQGLVDAMRPGVERGEADIMEWFGSHGMGNSGSAPAIAMGDYLSQVQLNEGQIFAGLYEQSVQNYMNVLMGGKGPAPKSFFDNYLDWVKTMSTAATAAAAGG